MTTVEFPWTRRPPLVRTCTDGGEGPWNELLGIIGTPDPADAVFEVVQEDLFGGWPVERVVASALDDGPAARFPLMVVVDERTLTDHGFPAVAADLRRHPGRTFRVAAAELCAVGHEVEGHTTEFAAFADHAELQPDRVFRGFRPAGGV